MSGSFFKELKRRNVFRVAVIYIVSSWLLMQIGDVMFPALLLPAWSIRMLVALLILGFPLAIVFAWAYEITSDGIVRTDDVPAGRSVSAKTAEKINRLIIAVLAVAVAVLFVRNSSDEPVAEIEPHFVISDQSIAVLPFRNLSASEEDAEFFAVGLHDELLTLLSKIGGMKVISRTSVERLDDDLSISGIGELLGVATILEGQVQRSGDRLRINVQLIDTSGEDHLWANTYNRELTAANIFDVQSDIARTISGALSAELTNSDEQLLQDVPTTNTAALERYLLGVQLRERSSWDALRSASDYFREAIKLDADFAQAWAALASVQQQLLQTGAINLQHYSNVAGPAINRALELNNELSEAHSERGNFRWNFGDLAGAEESFRKSLQLNPNLPYALLNYGAYLRSTNRPAEAIPVLEKALARDPLSPLVLFDLGKSEMYLGNIEKTLFYAEKILEIDPASVYGYAGNLQAHFNNGRMDLGIPWMIKLLAVDPDDFESWAYMSLWLEQFGLSEIAQQYLTRAYELGSSEPVVLKCAVQIHSLMGQQVEAVEIARRAIDAKMDDRWYSNRVFLRQIRDAASTHQARLKSLELYKDRHPELFDGLPTITIDNINAAADVAFLLQDLGQDSERVQAILSASLEWHDTTRPDGVFDMQVGIVKVDLLVHSGNIDGALDTLREAVESGWIYNWRWYLDSPNFDTIRDLPEFQSIVMELQNIMKMQRDAYLAHPDMGEFDLRT